MSNIRPSAPVFLQIDQDLAQPFRTGGSGLGYTLSSVEIDTTFDTTDPVSDLPTLKVLSGSVTGTEVATLTQPASITGRILKYAAPASVTLAAETKYWLVMTDGTRDREWYGTRASTVNATSAPGWTISPGLQGPSPDFRELSAGSDFIHFRLRVNGTVNPPNVDFAESAYSVNEGGSVDVTVNLSASLASEVVIPITATVQGTTSAADYSLAATGVTIASGETSGTVSFSATDDLVIEPDESVQLSFGMLPTGVVAGTTTTTTTVTIVDNDRVLVSNIRLSIPVPLFMNLDLAQPFRTGGSGLGYTLSSVEIDTTFDTTDPVSDLPTLKVLSGSVTGTEVATLTKPDSITGRYLTYAAPASVTLAANTKYWLVMSDGHRNQRWFGTRASTVNATSAPGWTISPGLQGPSPNFIEIPVGSDFVYFRLRVNGTVNPPNVDFAESAYSVNEGGSVDVTVNLSASLASEVVIPITATVQGTTSAADYSLAATGVTIASGETSGTVSFSATDDLVIDPDESVQLSFGMLPADVVAGTTTTTTVTIVDNSDPSVSEPAGSDLTGDIQNMRQTTGLLTQEQPVTGMLTEGDDSGSRLGRKGDYYRLDVQEGHYYRVQAFFKDDAGGSVPIARGGSLVVDAYDYRREAAHGMSGSRDHNRDDGYAIVTFIAGRGQEYYAKVKSNDLYYSPDDPNRRHFYHGKYHLQLTDITGVERLAMNVWGGHSTREDKTIGTTTWATNIRIGTHEDGYRIDRLEVFIIDPEADATPVVTLWSQVSGDPGNTVCTFMPLEGYASGILTPERDVADILYPAPGKCPDLLPTSTLGRFYWLVFEAEDTSKPYDIAGGPYESVVDGPASGWRLDGDARSRVATTDPPGDWTFPDDHHIFMRLWGTPLDAD